MDSISANAAAITATTLSRVLLLGVVTNLHITQNSFEHVLTSGVGRYYGLLCDHSMDYICQGHAATGHIVAAITYYNKPGCRYQYRITPGKMIYNRSLGDAKPGLSTEIVSKASTVTVAVRTFTVKVAISVSADVASLAKHLLAVGCSQVIPG
jgi:hypothetical protein